VEPYRILIVEDDLEHIDLIRIGFRRHDEFFLDFAATGEQGLEMVSKNSYDLISVDLVLPGIGGLDVLVRIRRLDPDIPVVMVSGHGTTEMAVVAFENRATKFVVKSIESLKSLPYIFENLIQEARFKASERAMRERIRRSERIYRSIVENALAGLYILRDGTFKVVNPKLSEIFGCPPESLVGTPFWQLLQPDSLECVSRLDQGGDGPAPAYEARVLRRDGKSRWIEFRTVQIEFEGERAILGNLIDITQRKKLEVELLRSNRELSALNAIAARALQPEGDLEKDLGAALSHVVSGLDGAEVGGIFLKEADGLVLRSLHGSVEELIDFVQGREHELPLSPRAYSAKDRLWASAPIASSGRIVGVVVVALKDDDGKGPLLFLENVVGPLGRLAELSRLQAPPKEEGLLGRA
jgi:PAS domain S-box-containing protein